MRTIASLAFLIPCLLSPPGLHAGEDPVSACERKFVHQPESEDAAKCFYDLPATFSDASIRKLTELVRRYPAAPWARVYLALMTLDKPGAEDLLRDAAARLSIQGDSSNELWVRYFLFPKVVHRNIEEAGLEAQRAGKAASAQSIL